MTRAKFYQSVTSFFFLFFALNLQANDFKTILIGGGLNVCTSLHEKHCEKPLKLSENDQSEKSYVINDENVAQLTRLYQLDASLHTSVMDSFLVTLKLLKSKPPAMTETQLKSYFRRDNIVDSMRLTQTQWHMTLDVLQETPTSSSFLQKDKYKDVKVDVFNSKELFVPKAFRQFIDQVDGDEILIVTAAKRDAFEDVYWLIKSFEQFDVDVKWLPIDLAVNTIWQQAGTTDEEALSKACGELVNTRHRVAKRYYRERIYPELNAAMINGCESPKDLIEWVEESDGIYFHEGEPSVLRDSLMFNDIKANPVFEKIVERHNANKITLAFNGGAVRALSGNTGRNGFLVKGNSFDAYQTGLEIKESQLVLSKVKDENRPTLSLLGLNLFDSISFDTSFNEMSRHGRLTSLLATLKIPLGVGIDERTTLSIGQSKDGLSMQVDGEAGVTIIENGSMELLGLSPFRANKIVLNYLTQDDKALIKDNKVTIDFANWKFSSNRYSQPVVKAGSVFRPGNFGKTLYMLCTTGAKNAVLKHTQLGTGHKIDITKMTQSVSVSGSRNVSGDNYGYCSFRGYELSAKPL